MSFLSVRTLNDDFQSFFVKRRMNVCLYAILFMLKRSIANVFVLFVSNECTVSVARHVVSTFIWHWCHAGRAIRIRSSPYWDRYVERKAQIFSRQLIHLDKVGTLFHCHSPIPFQDISMQTMAKYSRCFHFTLWPIVTCFGKIHIRIRKMKQFIFAEWFVKKWTRSRIERSWKENRLDAIKYDFFALRLFSICQIAFSSKSDDILSTADGCGVPLNIGMDVCVCVQARHSVPVCYFQRHYGA